MTLETVTGFPELANDAPLPVLLRIQQGSISKVEPAQAVRHPEVRYKICTLTGTQLNVDYAGIVTHNMVSPSNLILAGSVVATDIVHNYCTVGAEPGLSAVPYEIPSFLSYFPQQFF